MIVQLVMLATPMHNRKNGPFRSLVAWLPKTFEARYKPGRSYLYPKHDSIVQGGWCMPAHIVIVIRSSRSTLHGLIHLSNWTRAVNIIAFNIFTFGAGFFLYMLCCLLIEGIEFLLRDSLLHVPFFVLQIKNVQENDHLQYFFPVRHHHLLSLTRLTCGIWTKNYHIYF